jgi:hypothetical protein
LINRVGTGRRETAHMTDKGYGFSEDDLVLLSALQHLLFCERQCALIHVEQTWVENLYTAEGRITHKRVDSGRSGCGG